MKDIKKELYKYLNSKINIFSFKGEDKYLFDYFLEYILSNLQDIDLYKFSTDNFSTDYLNSLLLDGFLFMQKKVILFYEFQTKESKEILKKIKKKKENNLYLFVFFNCKVKDKDIIEFDLNKVSKLDILKDIYKDLDKNLLSIFLSFSNMPFSNIINELNKISLSKSSDIISKVNKDISETDLFSLVNKLLKKDKDIRVFIDKLYMLFNENIIWAYLMSSFNLYFKVKILNRTITNIDVLSKLLSQKKARLYFILKDIKNITYKKLYFIVLLLNYLDNLVKTGKLTLKEAISLFILFYYSF